MAIDFNKWNEEFGGEEAIKETKEAAKNEFKEVVDGTYVCKLDSLELAESKNHKPMIKGQFKIMEGEYKNQKLFVNQVITAGYPLHKGLEFLRSLEIYDDGDIDFDGNYEHFNDLLLDLAEDGAAYNLSYEVKKTKDGDFTRLEVTEVYEA